MQPIKCEQRCTKPTKMFISWFAWLTFASFRFVDSLQDRPLILTPYIEDGKIEEARKAALVTGIQPHVESYAGFFNVDKKCDSNLFFWFFPSQSNPKKDPVSVWLNGGPGSSSMSSLLFEHGPYELTDKNELKLREYSWNRNSSVIYVDNPVGTGYSFTKGRFDDCYSKNQTHIGRSMLRALEQFFKLFPELSDNPFYLTGVSYAGKYIPGIAHAIHTSKTNVRLDGVAIGNGWMDPVTQVKSHEFFYQLGFIDERTKAEMKASEDIAVELIKKSKFLEATDAKKNASDLFMSKTGYTSLCSYLEFPCEEMLDHTQFMNRTDIRKALHVGNAIQNNGSLSYIALLPDVMKSIKPWLETLMNHYRVLLYFGQADMLIAPAYALEFIKTLHWKGAEDYAKAERRMYKVGQVVAGYVKTAGNFSEMWIRHAGHRATRDRPIWTFDMYNKFIYNVPFAP